MTSIDRDVQRIAEQALTAEITKRRTERDKEGNLYAAPSGAAVVLDPRDGRVIALASTPTYDPTVFVGGISKTELARLTDPNAGTPLLSRAVQGQFAPGSTFKLSSASAEVMSGRAPLSGPYSCPGSLQVGNTTKNNFSRAAGTPAHQPGVALAILRHISTACADRLVLDEAASTRREAGRDLQRMARRTGSDRRRSSTCRRGADLRADRRPGVQADPLGREQVDLLCGRQARLSRGDRPGPADVLTRLAAENCTDGWRFQVGDAANLAIGQGETTVSPLQLAVAYSALVNGGTLWEPRLGRAIVDPDGKVVREIKAKSRGTVPVSQQVIDYIKSSLAFTAANGASGSVAFGGFPLDKVLVGGKTGTAEVFGKQDTSWFASWAPADKPARYVVVAMIEQAGLGAQAAAPVTRAIYEGIYGLTGKKAALPNGPPAGSRTTAAGERGAQGSRRARALGPRRRRAALSSGPATRADRRVRASVGLSEERAR